jgi:CheY-like chemotaxis protein
MSAHRALGERRGKAGAQGEPRLILADQDVWCRAIADGALRAQGYRVVSTGDVETAARVARELLPDLVVADVSLPFIENVPSSQRRSADRAPRELFPRVSPAYAVLRPLELEPSGAVHPVVLLMDQSAGTRARASRFGVLGYVAKPFTPFTLVQSLETHVGRLRFRTGVSGVRTPPSPSKWAEGAHAAPALQGSVDLIGMPAILEILHYNRLSGVGSFETASGRSAEVHFRQGEIVSAHTDDGLEGAAAVFRLVAWTDGRFAFVIQQPSEKAGIQQRFEQLMLEGMRRIDEERLFPFRMLLGDPG